MPKLSKFFLSLIVSALILVNAVSPALAGSGDWHQLPMSPNAGTPTDIAFSGSTGYVYYTRSSLVNGVITRDIIQSDGYTSQTILPSGGLNDDATTIDVSPNSLVYAFGPFTEIAGQPTTYIASWNRVSWSQYSGLSSTPQAHAFDNTSRLYIGGGFGATSNVNWVSYWNGTGWTQLPTTGAPDAQVTSLAFGTDNKLYAAFQTWPNPGGVYFFNGSSWTQMGTNNSYMDRLDMIRFAPDGSMYVGKTLRKWNGSNFVNVPWGGSGPLTIKDMAFDRYGRLIIAGSFTTPGPYLALLDFNDGWMTLGTAPNAEVSAIAVDKYYGFVYTAGSYSQIGGQNISHAAFYEMPVTSGTVQIGFQSTSYQVQENGGNLTVTVRLSAPSVDPVGAKIVTASGTAGTSDFTTINTGFSIIPGQTSVQVQIPITNDAVKEGNESFYVRLSKPNFATLGVSETIATIVDDDTDTSFGQGFSSGASSLSAAYTFTQGTFNSQVTGTFQTQSQFTAKTLPSAPVAPPTGYKQLSSYVDVSLTDAAQQKINFSSASVCLPYTDAQLTATGLTLDQLKLLHYNGSAWEDVTSSVDSANHQVCGVTASFSPFVIAGASQSDTPQSYGGQITILPGILSVNANTVNFNTVFLDGIRHVVSGSTSSWVAKDASGVGDGWHVVIASTDFQDVKGHIIPVDGLSIGLSDAAIVAVDGNDKPVSLATSAVTLSQTPQKLLSAVNGQGMGTYSFTPEFNLVVLPNVYAGTYYAMISLDIIAAP